MEVFGGGEFQAEKLMSEGCPGSCKRIKTLGDEIEDSGVVEVVPEHVSLKVFSRSAFLASAVEDLKSAAARRTRSTPRPVPVRIQSCAELVATEKQQRQRESKRDEGLVEPSCSKWLHSFVGRCRRPSSFVGKQTLQTTIDQRPRLTYRL
jgi:hypothetical protein